MMQRFPKSYLKIPGAFHAVYSMAIDEDEKEKPQEGELIGDRSTRQERKRQTGRGLTN